VTNAIEIDDDPFADIADTPRMRARDPMPTQLRLANALMPSLDPFMSCFAREMQWTAIDNPALWIMATNCIDTFFYNPTNIVKLDLKAPLLACIIAHEIKHILRMDADFMRGRNPEKANIALDAVINRDLINAGWRWPGMRFHNPLNPPISTSGMSGIATQHTHETALTIYNKLRDIETARAKNLNALKDGVREMPREMQGEDAQDRLRAIRKRAQKAMSEAEVLSDAMRAMERDKTSQAAAETEAKKEAAERQKKEDDAKAVEESADASDPFENLAAQDDGDPFENLANGAGEPDGEGEGEGASAGPDDDDDDESGDGAGECNGSGDAEGDGAPGGWGDHMSDIGRGLEGAGNEAGGNGWSIEKSAAYPDLEKLGMFVAAPHVKLERALGSRVQGVLKGWSKRSRSYQTPHSLSRRFGRIMPGARQQRVYQIAIAIDCSGSITVEDLQLFSALAHAWARKFARQADIHMCFYNTKVIRDGTSDYFANVDNIPRPGGGTDFRPVFGEWLGNLPHRPTHVLHFSDLDGSWPDEPQGVNVVHLVPPRYRNATAPFGEILVIEE
jgi:hypothetical protein